MTKRSPLFASCLLMVAAACGGGGGDGGSTAPPTPVATVTRLDVSLSATSIAIAATSQASVRVFDQSNREMFSQSVTWSASPTTVASVSGAGLVTAIASGTTTIVATAANGISGSATLTVQAPPVASVSLGRDTATVNLGATLQLTPVLRDAAGNPLPDRTIAWSSTNASIATVSSSGLVTGVSIGDADVLATVEGRFASVRVAVRPRVTALSPTITSISAPVLTPGASVIFTGTNFSPTASGNLVRIDGVNATVTASTATSLSVTIPATGFACEATHGGQIIVQVGLEAGIRSYPLQTATPRALTVGQSIVLTDAAESRCNELTQTGGRYVVSVFNTTINSGANSDYQLRGAASTALTTTPIPAAAPLATGAFPAARASGANTAAGRGANALGMMQRMQQQQHARVVERNIALLQSGATAFRTPRPRATRAGALADVGTLGSINRFRIPDLDATTGAAFCRNNFPIQARTVYSGTRAIIVEDTASLFNGTRINTGQMDTLYQRLGQEFDSVSFPILTTNFGNPLKMDDLLDNNGKIIMLFSPRVNQFQTSVFGFIAACDFFAAVQYPSSNEAEMFYAYVPTSTASGGGEGTRELWYRFMRSTVIHEAKHITSFAERIRGDGLPEQYAFEEGTALHAEELFAREVSYQRLASRTNARYANTLFCEVRPSSTLNPQCGGTPFVTYYHFDALYGYLVHPEQLSVLGRPFNAPDDGSFYGSNWALVRWAMDHFTTSDASFLSAMTQAPRLIGVSQFSERTGRAWEESFGEFTLAMLLDDLPGFTPRNPRLSFLSWNLRDIFAGMNSDFPQFYNKPYPVVAAPLSFGAFDVTVSLPGGAFSLYELGGTQSGAQLLDLRTNGPGIRVALVRIQ